MLLSKEDGLREWKKYTEKSDKHKDTLHRKEPDIVEKINEHIRKEKEEQKVEMKVALLQVIILYMLIHLTINKYH